MKSAFLFPTEIYEDYITNIDNAQLIEECRKIYSEKNQTCKLVNSTRIFNKHKISPNT